VLVRQVLMQCPIMQNLHTIELSTLDLVTGGVNGPAPVKPVQPAIPNFGGTRYSADWWSKFNASPAGQAQR
jgi:hypothetical protein